MPHLKVSGITKEKLKKFSTDLISIVEEESSTSKKYIKVFYNPIDYIQGNEDEIVIIEVYWMPRPQEICDRLALKLTEFFKEKGYSFVQVNYSEFPGNLFYENGIHY